MLQNSVQIVSYFSQVKSQFKQHKVLWLYSTKFWLVPHNRPKVDWINPRGQGVSLTHYTLWCIKYTVLCICIITLNKKVLRYIHTTLYLVISVITSHMFDIFHYSWLKKTCSEIHEPFWWTGEIFLPELKVAKVFLFLVHLRPKSYKSRVISSTVLYKSVSINSLM